MVIGVCRFSLVTSTVAVLAGIVLSPIGTVRMSEAIRIGVVAPTTGAVAAPMWAGYEGFTLALKDQNAKGGIQGQPLEWQFAPSTANISGVDVLIAEQVVDQWMANESTRIDMLAIPGSGLLTSALYRAAAKHKLTVFGPVSGERGDFLEYSTTRLLVSPMPDMEMAALIRYMVLTRHLKRIAVMTTYGAGIGNDLIPYIGSVLAEFGLEIAYNYRVRTPGQTTAALVAEGVQRGVQAVIMLGMIETSTVEAIGGVFSKLNRKDDWMFATTQLSSPVFAAIFGSLPLGAAGNNNLITTTYCSILTDSSRPSVRTFERLMGEHEASLKYKRNVYNGVGSTYGLFSMACYYVGCMLTAVLRRMGSNPINSSTIIDEAFGDTIFPIDELLLGPYSKPCEEVGRTKACGCHSGARAVNLAYFDPTMTLYRIPDATMDISMDICLPVGLPIQSPLIQLIAAPTNSSLLSPNSQEVSMVAIDQFIAGDRAGYINISTSPSSRTGILMKQNYSTVGDLVAIHANRITTVSMGTVYAQQVEAFSDQVTVALDPLYTVPLLHSGFAERVVHFMPTLQQEVHALTAQYASLGGFRVLTTVVDPAFARGLSESCRKSSHTFGYEYVGQVDVVESIASALSAATGGGAVMVHGLQTGADIAAMNEFLSAHPTGVIIIPFHHVALWYDVIVSSIGESSHRQRVVFATSLPSWNAASMHVTSQSTIMKSYYAAMIAQGLPYTPQTLRGYLTQRVVANIVERIPSALTQTSFLSTLYSVSIVVLDAVAYSIGPLSNVRCAQTGGTAVPNCENNIGARQLWVRTLDSVTSSDTAVAQRIVGELLFGSGTIDYRELPQTDGLSTLAIALIIVGVVVVLLILIVVLMRVFSGRSHANAPKDEKKPFTIIFTDIQSSTSLWAEIPEEMGKALEVHHAIIRTLIKRHRGYEVKTIGDAFMIAFKRADDAIELAFALQYAFYECADFAPVIDQAYLSFDREKSGESVPNLSCELTPEDYAARWHGLRVRVGINTDFGTIQKDPVTQAYDYYGTVTNTAARVESVAHGGQVCFTQGTLSSLSNLQLDINTTDTLAPELQHHVSKRNGPRFALKMGEKELRGLSNNVMMYQLECTAGRLYPPLRLEMEVDAEDFDGNDGYADVDDFATALGDSQVPTGSAIQGSGTTGSGSRRVSRTNGDETQSVGSSAKNGAEGKQRTFTAEVSSLHIMITLFTLFSRIPQPEKKAKEFRRMCDLWGIKVDKKTVERAKLWGSLKPSTEMNSNRMMAIHLSKEDASAAAHVEVLSRRIRNIVSKNLQNTVVVTHGVGALRVENVNVGRDDGTISLNASGHPSMQFAAGPLGIANDNGRFSKVAPSFTSASSPEAKGLKIIQVNAFSPVETPLMHPSDLGSPHDKSVESGDLIGQPTDGFP